jgi:hypothetical protein
MVEAMLSQSRRREGYGTTDTPKSEVLKIDERQHMVGTYWADLIRTIGTTHA